MELQTIIGDSDASMEAQLIEHAHTLSMSKDPTEAAKGRFLKEVLPAYSRWLHAERLRVKTFDDVEAAASGIVRGITNMVASFTMTMFVGQPEAAAAIAAAMGEDIKAFLDRGTKLGAFAHMNAKAAAYMMERDGQ